MSLTVSCIFLYQNVTNCFSFFNSQHDIFANTLPILHIFKTFFLLNGNIPIAPLRTPVWYHCCSLTQFPPWHFFHFGLSMDYDKTDKNRKIAKFLMSLTWDFPISLILLISTNQFSPNSFSKSFIQILKLKL